MTALPEFSIEGKKAIVTGAGRGIGKAIALTLAEAGVDVCVAARSRDELDAVADEIRGMGRRAAAIPTDITDEASVAAMVDGAVRELGEIDVLVNNAGIAVVKPLVPLPGLKPATADSFPGFLRALHVRGMVPGDGRQPARRLLLHAGRRAPHAGARLGQGRQTSRRSTPSGRAATASPTTPARRRSTG